MKKSIGIVFILVLILCLAPVLSSIGAAPPPPPPINIADGGGAYIGGAPIGNGLLILVALGLAYGAKRLYDLRKRKIVE